MLPLCHLQLGACGRFTCGYWARRYFRIPAPDTHRPTVEWEVTGGLSGPTCPCLTYKEQPWLASTPQAHPSLPPLVTPYTHFKNAFPHHRIRSSRAPSRGGQGRPYNLWNPGRLCARDHVSRRRGRLGQRHRPDRQMVGVPPASCSELGKDWRADIALP